MGSFQVVLRERGMAALGLSLGTWLQIIEFITFGMGALDDTQFNK